MDIQTEAQSPISAKICASCGSQNPRKSHRYCAPCHAAYMREWRRTHRMSDEARRKDIVRSIAGVMLRRGKIKREPCADCGSEKAEMHHPEYIDPLDIVWLCPPCRFGRFPGKRAKNAI